MEEVQFGKEKEPFNYKLVQENIEELCIAIPRLIERQWPKEYNHVDSARIIFSQSLRIAVNTYGTIFFIIADVDYYARRKVFALSLAPLVRTLFEQLVALIFLLQDIPRYIPLLFKTGYVERVIQLEHAEKYHGQKDIWKPYIEGLRKQITLEAETARLTADEIANPKKKIGYWPTPGAVVNRFRQDRTASQGTLDFVEYVKDWLYRELSGQTHLNVSGITMRGVHLSDESAKLVFGDDDWEKLRDEKMEEYRQKQVWLTIVLMLSIISEIEGHFNFGRNHKAREVWTHLNNHSDIALDFWEARYSNLLPT
jgi:hypothetical protein